MPVPTANCVPGGGLGETRLKRASSPSYRLAEVVYCEIPGLKTGQGFAPHFARVTHSETGRPAAEARGRRNLEGTGAFSGTGDLARSWL